MQPALLLIELESIALGTEIADAMIKRAPLDTIRAGTVQPGRFLILVGGSVAAVEEALTEANKRSPDILDRMFLPDVHPDVYKSVAGRRRKNQGDALGVIETASVAAVIRAADKALKTADVQLVEIRLGDGLGGKGIALVSGKLEEVQAAVEAGLAAAGAERHTRSVVIAAQHEELRKHLEASTEFFSTS